MSNTQTSTVSLNGSNNLQSPTSTLVGSLTPIALMVLVFYFLIMRPQQKREAKRRELINSLKKGDRIVTSGGIMGTVHKLIDEQEISLEVSDGVNIKVLKTSIIDVVKKPDTKKVAKQESESNNEKATDDLPAKKKTSVKRRK